MNDLKIGDNVNFVKGRMMYSGKITKFYKNYHNREECSVATEVGTFPHILLQKVSKINDEDDLIKKIADLEAKLAEKDELLRQKIGKMKSTDFIKMCIKSGYVVEAKENYNQTAIAELEKVKANDLFNDLGFKKNVNSNTFLVYLFETDYDKLYVNFDLVLKKYYVTSKSFIDRNDIDFIPMEERPENIKHSTRYGHWQSDNCIFIDMKLHNAIHQQLLELGWIKGDVEE